MGKAVSKEQSINEINQWLNFKNVRSKKRKTNEDSIDELVEGIEEGYLTFDADTNELTLELGIPLGTDGQIKSLTFKPRMSVGEIHEYLKKVKPGDADGRLTAYVKALTGQPSAVIDSMDTGDSALTTSIVVFFL